MGLWLVFKGKKGNEKRKNNIALLYNPGVITQLSY